MQNIQKKPVNSEERQRLIKTLIRDFPGLSVEEICKKAEPHMARNTYFKELNILVKSGEVTKKFVNKKEKKLYINDYNPLNLVAKELERFEKNFIELAKKTRYKCDLIFLSDALSNPLHKSIFYKNEEITTTDWIIIYYTLLMVIIFHLIESYQHRFLLKWLSTLQEDDKIQLFKIIFLKLSNILDQLTNIFKDLIESKKYVYYFYNKDNKQLKGGNFLMTLEETFNLIKLKKEVDKIINEIWNIDHDLCEFIYNEPKIYQFEFDFKKNSYKEFLKKYRPFWINSLEL